MRRAVLIVMLDVMVLSVLALNAGKGSSRLLVPAHRWSEVIEKGLQKEQQMEDALQELKDALAKAENEALKAQDLAKMALEGESDALKARERLQAEKEATRRALEATRVERESAKASQLLAEEQAKHAREMAAEAKKREEQSVQREKESLARRRDAEIAARESLARAGDAVAKAAEAEVGARAAELRADEALLAERDAVAAVARARLEARALEVNSATAEETARKAEVSEKYALDMTRELQKQIRDTTERVELAMVREGTALERARLAEKERERVTEEKDETFVRVEELSASLAAFEQKELNSTERLADARKRLEEYQQQLAERKAEKSKGSVWVKREQALRLLQVVMVETEPGRAPFTRRKALFMPRVKLGENVVTPAEFGNLGFGVWWYQSKVDRYVSRLAFALGPVPGSAAAEGDVTRLVRSPLLFDRSEPRICMVPTERGSALQAIGIDALKAEKIQRVLLFKSESPDRRVKVDVTPSVSGMLLVEVSESSSKSSPEAGDYLLTEDGRFVGLMVNKNECYVFPTAMPQDARMLKVPLVKPEKAAYYNAFVNALDDVRKMVKVKDK